MKTPLKVLADERDAAADKLKRLKSEADDIQARIAAEPAAADKLKERLSNLATGLARASAEFAEADAAYGAKMLESVRNGGFGVLSGDDTGPAGDRRARHRLGGAGASTGQKSSPIAEAMLDAGFNLRTNPSVELKAFDTIADLKSTTVPAVGDWNRQDPVLVPMAQDRRWLWPLLPMQDAGSAASVQDFKQTARTLTGTVQRTLNATTDKANLATTTSLVNEALVEFAVTLDDIPNAVLESVPQFQAYMASEGEFQVMQAIDAHVMAQIVAATPANGLSGTNLITQLRNGISAMRALGAQPSIAVLNPSDSVTLDTYQATDGAYLFPTRSTNTASPLWDLRIVERIGAGTEEPFLIDPALLGVLYLGSMRFDADPYTGFKKNLTTLRVEVKGLFHVRNAAGAYEIVA